MASGEKEGSKGDDKPLKEAKAATGGAPEPAAGGKAGAAEGKAGAAGGKAGAAGGLGSAAPPAGAKQFFLIEYVKEIMRGLRWLRSSPKPEEPTLRRVQKGFFRWSRGRKSRIGVVVTIGFILISYILFSAQAGSTETATPPIGGGGPGENNGTWAASGTVSENGQTAVTIMPSDAPMPGSFAHLTILLTWSDEPASNPTVRNTPDNLGLNVTAPNGMSWELAPVSSQRVTFELEANATGQDLGGVSWADWTITVLGGTMGDEVPITGRGGPCLRCQTDNSNAFSLSADFSW